MAICQTCHTDDARPTKTECWNCYRYRKNTGETRSEATVIKNNQRRFEREILRKQRSS